MENITQVKRYLPHEITTKIGSVKLYRETKDSSFVCRGYHIIDKYKKTSLKSHKKLDTYVQCMYNIIYKSKKSFMKGRGKRGNDR